MVTDLTLLAFCLVSHAPHRPFDGVVLQLIHLDPGEIVGFLGDDKGFLPVVLQKKPNVVVIMGRFLLPGRDAVDIEVENLRTDGLQSSQSGFLETLLHRDSENIGVSIGMASRLEPEIQLPVMRQERLPARHIENPGRRGDVSLSETPLEALRISHDKITETKGIVPFRRIAGKVAVDEIKKGVSMHGRTDGRPDIPSLSPPVESKTVFPI
jgi:hypothetical protein